MLQVLHGDDFFRRVPGCAPSTRAAHKYGFQRANGFGLPSFTHLLTPHTQTHLPRHHLEPLALAAELNFGRFDILYEKKGTRGFPGERAYVNPTDFDRDRF